MRFACQSCGKAYNLPEERIAEKSNVKLKCRVCGVIVEVKKQGEIVAQILNEGEGRRIGRVSEAPTPLMSMGPDDADDATSAIAVGEHGPSEQQLNDFSLGDSSGQLQVGQNNRGVPFVPPASPTGFGGMPPPLSQDGDFQHDLQSGGFEGGAFQDGAFQGGAFQDGFQPNPLARPEAVAAPAYASSGAVAPPRVPSSLPPPPLRSPGEAAQNGSNGSARRVGEAALGFAEAAVRAPVASAVSVALPAVEMASLAPAPMSRGTERDDTRSKMMAALATGMLIGFIIAKLFF
jgi:hypothetical protein